MNISEAEKTLFLKGTYGEAELSKAYRKMISEYHPDKFSSQSEDMQSMAAEKMKAINEANKLLKKELAGGRRITAGEHDPITSASGSTSSTAKTSPSKPQTYAYVPPKEGTAVSTTSSMKDPDPVKPAPNSTGTSGKPAPSSTARSVYSDPISVKTQSQPRQGSESSSEDNGSRRATSPKNESKLEAENSKPTAKMPSAISNGKPATWLLVVIAAIAVVMALWGMPVIMNGAGNGNDVEGCSWTDAEVVGSGFTVLPDGTVSIGAIVQNGNADHALRYAGVEVTAYGPEGEVVGTAKIRTSGVALPGAVTFAGNAAAFKPADDKSVERLDCRVVEDSTSFVESIDDPYEMELVLDSWKMTPEPDGASQHVSATASNPNASDFDKVSFNIVFMKDGSPVFVDVEELPSRITANGGFVTLDSIVASPPEGTWDSVTIQPSVVR